MQDIQKIAQSVQRLQKRKKTFGFWIKLGFSLVLLFVIFRNVRFNDFYESIVSINKWWFALSVIAFFPAQLLAAYRWYFLLNKLEQRIDFRIVLRHTILGQFAALFLPGQISGDIVRTFAIAQGKNSKFVFIKSTIIDKVLLLAATAIFSLVGGIYSNKFANIQGIFVLSSVIIIMSFLVLLLMINDNLVRSIISPLKGFPIVSVFDNKIKKFTNGVINVKFYAIFETLLLACLLQLIYSIGGFFMIKAMNLPLPMFDWFAINAIVAIIQVLPISIGGLGVREGILSSLFLLYNIPISRTAAFSLINFFCSSLLIAGSWLLSDYLLKKYNYYDDDQL
jgi:uncharacterized protein (TIRG00374 family)